MARGNCTFETVPYEEDLARNCRWICEARANADCVVVGLHQQGATRSVDEAPDHTRIFAHAAIDAGADVFVAHGHGWAGGIEVRHGRPIIYGLPGIINQISQVRSVPLEQRLRLGLGCTDLPSEFMARRSRGEAKGGTEFESRRAPFHPMVLHSVTMGPDGRLGQVRLYPFEAISEGPISRAGAAAPAPGDERAVGPHPGDDGRQDRRLRDRLRRR